MNSLADSFDVLYSAFSDVPKPTKIEGCPCCLDKKGICTLLSKPLRELSGGELASYSESAFLTVGEQADYLYFLPRIVEIACLESGWWPDVEITGRAIGETRPSDWPERRRAALLNVLHVALQEAINDESGWTIDGLICAIARMGVDVGPFLQQIETSSKAVLSYYEENSESLIKQKLGNAFWDHGSPGFETVVAWFKSPTVSQIILDGYGLTPNSGQQAVAPNA